MLGRRAVAALGAVFATLSLAPIGCSNGENRGTTPDKLAEALAQTRPAPPEVIAMLRDVAEIRGLPPPASIRLGTVSRDNLPALLDALLTADDRTTFNSTTTLYRLLGHLRPDQDYLSVYRAVAAQSAIGLYSPTHDTLWIVDPQPVSTFNLNSLSAGTRAALAHELVHAVQDANFPLDELRQAVAGNLDASLALAALLEGDAVTHQALYVARFQTLPSPGPAVTAAPAPRTSDVPPSISRELFFPYTTGAEWFGAVRAAGGTSAVAKVLSAPPRATSTILHPELEATNWSPVSVNLPDLSSSLGKRWRRESGGTFGEFQLRNYLQLRLPGIPAATAAGGWSGDRYDVYARDGEAVAVFRLVFTDDAEAAEFAATHETFLATGGALPSMRDGLAVTASAAGPITVSLPRNGQAVTFVIGSSEAIAIRAAGLLRSD